MEITPRTAVTQLLRSVKDEAQSRPHLEDPELIQNLQDSLVNVQRLFESGNPGAVATATILHGVARPLETFRLRDSSLIAAKLASHLQSQAAQYVRCASTVLKTLKKINPSALPQYATRQLENAIAILAPLSNNTTSDPDAVYVGLRKAYRALIVPVIEEAIAFFHTPHSNKDKAKYFRTWAVNLKPDIDMKLHNEIQILSEEIRDNVDIVETKKDQSLSVRLQRRWLSRNGRSVVDAGELAVRKLDPFYKVKKIVDDLDIALGITRPTRFQDISQRSFETILSVKLLENIPLSTCLGWDNFAGIVAQEFESLNAETKVSVAYETRRLQSAESPRFWYGEAEKTSFFMTKPQDERSIVPAFLQILTARSSTGWHVVEKASLMINYSRAMVKCAPGASGNDFRARGDRFYADVMQPRKGRSPYEEQKDLASQAVGITLANQKSIPYGGQSPQPSTRTVIQKPMNLNHKKIVASLDKQRLVASGISGSTNILLHNYNWALSNSSTLDLPDFIIGAIVLLVYNGGHSINEILWAVRHVFVGEANDLTGRMKSGSISDLKEIMVRRQDVIDIIDSARSATLEHLGGLHMSERENIHPGLEDAGFL